MGRVFAQADCPFAGGFGEDLGVRVGDRRWFGLGSWVLEFRDLVLFLFLWLCFFGGPFFSLVRFVVDFFQFWYVLGLLVMMMVLGWRPR